MVKVEEQIEEQIGKEKFDRFRDFLFMYGPPHWLVMPLFHKKYRVQAVWFLPDGKRKHFTVFATDDKKKAQYMKYLLHLFFLNFEEKLRKMRKTKAPLSLGIKG